MTSRSDLTARLAGAIADSLSQRSEEDVRRLEGLITRLADMRERGLLHRPKFSAPSQGDQERQYAPLQFAASQSGKSRH